MSATAFTVDVSSCETYTMPAVGTMDAVAYKNEVCKYYADGLIRSNYASDYYNTSEKKWDKADDYIRDHTNGTFALLTGPVISDGGNVGTVGRSLIPDIKSQRENDEALSAAIKNEYCHYRSRYNACITAFFNSVQPTTPPPANAANATHYLKALIELNARLNALNGLVDFIVNTRASTFDAKNTALNTMNAELNTAIGELSTANDFISDESVINTRKEMVRYTKEKNNAITNQISLWASLNIVALALIFHVYRSM